MSYRYYTAVLLILKWQISHSFVFSEVFSSKSFRSAKMLVINCQSTANIVQKKNHVPWKRTKFILHWKTRYMFQSYHTSEKRPIEPFFFRLSHRLLQLNNNTAEIRRKTFRQGNNWSCELRKLSFWATVKDFKYRWALVFLRLL